MNISAQQCPQSSLIKTLSITLLASMITACGSANNLPSTNVKPNVNVSNNDLTSMTWQLVSTAQKDMPANTTLNTGQPANRFSFIFKDGRLSIRGGCNQLSGSYKLAAGNRITIGPVMSTKKACAREIMESDHEIMSYLSGLTDYSITGQSLTLTTAFNQRLTLKGS